MKPSHTCKEYLSSELFNSDGKVFSKIVIANSEALKQALLVLLVKIYTSSLDFAMVTVF